MISIIGLICALHFGIAVVIVNRHNQNATQCLVIVQPNEKREWNDNKRWLKNTERETKENKVWFISAVVHFVRLSLPSSYFCLSFFLCCLVRHLPWFILFFISSSRVLVYFFHVFLLYPFIPLSWVILIIQSLYRISINYLTFSHSHFVSFVCLLFPYFAFLSTICFLFLFRFLPLFNGSLFRILVSYVFLFRFFRSGNK